MEEGAGEADFRSGAGFVKDVVYALEIPMPAVKVDTQGQLSVQEPWLDK